MKRVINTTFLYDLNSGAGAGTVPEWGMHCALFTGSLRATLTVHTLLCTIPSNQGKETLLRAAEIPMGRRWMEEADKICVQQGYITASH